MQKFKSHIEENSRQFVCFISGKTRNLKLKIEFILINFEPGERVVKEPFF